MNMSHQTLVEFIDVQKTYDGTELVSQPKDKKRRVFNTSRAFRVRKNNVPNDVSGV